MKIIKPSSEYLDRNIHPYKLIERIGRTCYKSEDKITEDSAVRFVKAMVAHRHFAMLEHGEIYLKLDGVASRCLRNYKGYDRYQTFKYISITDDVFVDKGNRHCAIMSGSFRAFIELCEFYKTQTDMFSDIMIVKTINNYLASIYPEAFSEEEFRSTEKFLINLITEKDVIQMVKTCKYISEDEKDDYLRDLIKHSVKFVCDRGVSHEFVRHRPCSFAQESTRYCNYSKDQFGNEITVIEPFYYADEDCAMENCEEEYKLWKESCEAAEKAYLALLKMSTPQEARAVLPNSLKTELIITANEKEWQHIIDLRYHGVTGKPHPQMYEAMDTIYETLLEKSEHRLH